MMRIYDGRESFYQWDVNQKITSTDFKVGDEVHFTNYKQRNALVTRTYELDGKVVADVPNILLQTATPILAYRYVADENVCNTVDEHTFDVNQRAKPDSYVYTETEVFTYNAILNCVGNIDSALESIVAIQNELIGGERT